MHAQGAHDAARVVLALGERDAPPQEREVLVVLALTGVVDVIGRSSVCAGSCRRSPLGSTCFLAASSLHTARRSSRSIVERARRAGRVARPALGPPAPLQVARDALLERVPPRRAVGLPREDERVARGDVERAVVAVVRGRLGVVDGEGRRERDGAGERGRGGGRGVRG